MDNNAVLWGATLEELKRGYIEVGSGFQCVCCGYPVEKGIVYPEDGVFYEAWRYMLRHIAEEHGSVLEYLLTLDKSATGLSDVQRSLLHLTVQGLSDADIQKRLRIGSPSTIRNHRFILREKERQARLFLAVMELMGGRDGAEASAFAPKGAVRAGRGKPARPAGGEEAEQALRRYFPQGPERTLQSFPAKEKHRLLVLAAVAEHFEPGRRYPEAEVDSILEQVFGDYALLRRYLVEYGFMERLADGSGYWRTERRQEEDPMTRRKELQELAKEIKTEAGVFQIRNKQNGKVFLDSSRNLKNLNGQRFELEMGSHRNAALQREWNEYGADAFEIGPLEILKKKETGYFDEKTELKELKAKWLKELLPFGEKGYNPEKDRPAE